MNEDVHKGQSGVECYDRSSVESGCIGRAYRFGKAEGRYGIHRETLQSVIDIR